MSDSEYVSDSISPDYQDVPEFGAGMPMYVGENYDIGNLDQQRGAPAHRGPRIRSMSNETQMGNSLSPRLDDIMGHL